MWRAWVAVGCAVVLVAGCGEGDSKPDSETLPASAVAMVAGEPVLETDFETFIRVPLGTHPYAKHLLDSYPDVDDCARSLREANVEPRNESGELVRGDEALATYCEDEFQKARAGTMSFLLTRAITDHLASEEGVTLSESELRAIILRDVGSPAQIERNMKAAGIGNAVLELPRVGAVSDRLEEHVATELVGSLNGRAAQRYAETHPEVLRVPERRRVRFIVTSSRSDAVAAKDAVRDAGWKAAAERFAAKGTSRQLGGQPVELAEADEPDKAHEAIFDAPLNSVQGPRKIKTGWLVFEVIASRGGQLSGPAARRAAKRAFAEERSRQAEAELARRRHEIERAIRCREELVIPMCGANAQAGPTR